MKGRSGWLTSRQGGFIAKPWRIASVADACHVLGVGGTRCCDKGLRPWMLGVTFSASPKTVTHAWMNSVSPVFCWLIAGQEMTADAVASH
jgi:hypothetical protein